ncbi:hypothetical protein QQA43_30995 (plasmid) [Mycolicibacterium vanbaalenii]|uniref:helix-turn-helix transcriptional regulator n=1 Tax=Mycolicibacterium vanbaalenii TaxID=110539 RepID=UPI001F3D8910|nr:hypothetical protein [Mycolicibacterium vanbaalenii]WND60076.1 hypothetical protein QQA43_30995 [Mycolicibacterium vanbaalenii]
MKWTTQLTYTADGLTAEDTEELAGTLAGADIAYADDRLQIQFEVDAAGLDDAANTALRTAAAATGLLKPTRLQILPTKDFQNQALQPVSLDLIGITEIAEELGVSRQRAAKLTKAADFPKHVAHPASGRVYTRASVREFHRRWKATRNPRGGRPRRQLTADTTTKS